MYTDNNSSDTLKVGLAELVAFTESVVAELVLKEESCKTKFSPLRFFCRVDVAVLYNKALQQHQFQVNGVGWSMCQLFTRSSLAPVLLSMAKSLESTIT